jgi:hypothetical protein
MRAESEPFATFQTLSSKQGGSKKKTGSANSSRTEREDEGVGLNSTGDV